VAEKRESDRLSAPDGAVGFISGAVDREQDRVR
jgi:hypothetical protein